MEALYRVIQKNLKAAMLHNGSKYASVPVGHSVHLKESYENLALVLTKLNCKDHGWICGDLKVLPMLLGQQSEYNLPSTRVSCVNRTAVIRLDSKTMVQ
jgi:hypothetical protein